MEYDKLPPNESLKRVITIFYNSRDDYLRKNKKKLTDEGNRILNNLYKENQGNIINRLHKGNNIEKLAQELIEKIMQSECMKDNLVNEVSNEPSA